MGANAVSKLCTKMDRTESGKDRNISLVVRGFLVKIVATRLEYPIRVQRTAAGRAMWALPAPHGRG